MTTNEVHYPGKMEPYCAKEDDVGGYWDKNISESL